MRHRERRGTRVRVLCWLLAVLTLAGLGLSRGGHCAAPAATETNVAAAAVTGPAGHERHYHAEGDGTDRHRMIDAGADNCHLQPARVPAGTIAAATVTTAAVHPPPGISTVPAGPAPAMRQPRMRGARPLTDIGVSRT